MKIEVLYFAQLKDIAQKGHELFHLTEGDTVKELFEQLKKQYGHENFETPSLMAAVNEEFAPYDYKLQEGDTVVLLPPVSGG